ncbi:hypothetical protein Aspvir_002324 [Aspergillus viridinutans]|uniref:Uncharacterized protein n=1 Tax=Aspergillus viridinutans TaxID=75553 RepID=A0A9P3F679_ASPVI|nr:uncharacterized protein Aspvir_002324 [Aspergillus viridinutans]GIK06674.1 hypothetical protein Aspvir_002324 [Aspergillus viridinutans]
MHVSKTLLTFVLAALAAVGAAAPAGSNTAVDASEADVLTKRPNFKIAYREARRKRLRPWPKFKSRWVPETM